METLAVTDVNGVYGVVQFQEACKREGVRQIFGAEVPIDDHHLVLLAENRDGYANLCQLLTLAHLRSREEPHATLEELEAHSANFFCLTGTREGKLWRLVDDRQHKEASAWVDDLKGIFADRLSIEIANWRYEGDDERMRHLGTLSGETGVPLVATGDVRYAAPEDYALYDLLTCIRLGITVFTDSRERPFNAEAYLKSEQALRELIPYEAAFDRASDIASSCHVDLIPGYITPPGARLPEGKKPREVLRSLLRGHFRDRYPPNSAHRTQAIAQVEHELEVIERLELEEFFLVVYEVTREAWRRNIRYAGRGSAANSIICYILRITHVCPIHYQLFFERWLHSGRKGTPDIDIDFDSSRRPEIIAWMEERFGREQTAMTANIMTYRTKGAIQDVAKALGWPAEMATEMSKACSSRSILAGDNKARVEAVAGPSPLVDTLFAYAKKLQGYPRHLGQHSGGMMLTRVPLSQFTPIQVSANGVLVGQFDKESVDSLGIVKLDVLGLRMMGCVSEAQDIIYRHYGTYIDLDTLPLDDIQVYNLICKGDTLGLFQIESPAQQMAGSQIQARTFHELMCQVALVRPGPVEGGTKHKFIKRHNHEEQVTFDHPELEAILSDTYGRILFQEQVLQVLLVLGLTLDEADAFRKLMSKFRDPTEMDNMRHLVVKRALNRGLSEETANTIFDQIRGFVGYGFCRSHAAAFAQLVYQSAWLKTYYPAAFYAGFFEHHPGMFSRGTLEQDARRHRIPILSPCINKSFVRYDIEQLRRGGYGVRKALTSVKHVSVEVARKIAEERARERFTSIEDVYHRVAIPYNALVELGRSGAFDPLEGSGREVLFKLHVLQERYGVSGEAKAATLFNMTRIRDSDIPELPVITLKDRIALDLSSHGAARVHPMRAARQALSQMEYRSVETVYALTKALPEHRRSKVTVTVAGIINFRQMPKTAKGVLFLYLEDETGTLQCIVRPEARDRLKEEVWHHAMLVVCGRVVVSGNKRALVVHDAWPLVPILGGFQQATEEAVVHIQPAVVTT